MDTQDLPIELELIRSAVHANIVVGDTRIAPTSADDKHVAIEWRLGLEEDEDGLPENDVEHFAFAFIYALGAQSFADARPRGVSGMEYDEKDEWSAADMLRCLKLRDGALHFYADDVRGRCLKSTLHVRADGAFLIDTVNRGEAATRWVARL